MLGFIQIGEDGEVYLEDQHPIKLSLSHAKSDGNSIFSEGMIVLVEGIFEKGISREQQRLRVIYMSHPPLYNAQKFRQTYRIQHNDQFGAYQKQNSLSSAALNYSSPTEPSPLTEPDDLSQASSKLENKCIVLISNIEIDQSKNMENLKKILSQVNDMILSKSHQFLIVLMGNFISQNNIDSLSFEDQTFYLNSLEAMIREFEGIKRSS